MNYTTANVANILTSEGGGGGGGGGGKGVVT